MKNFNLWSILFKDISIRNKFYMSFFWITVFLISSMAGGYYFINAGQDDALNIDVAGRTRMLSQRIYALAPITQSTDNQTRNIARKEFSDAIRTLGDIYDLFENGGTINQIDNSVERIKAVEDLKIQNKLKEIKPIYEEHKKLCAILENEPPTIRMSQATSFQPSIVQITSLSDTLASTSMNEKLIANPKITEALEQIQQLAVDGSLLKNNQQLVTLFSEKASGYRKYAEFIFIIFSLIGVGVVVLNFLLLQFYVVMPVNKIAKASQQIADGNINTSIHHDIKDGLGMIVNSISTLTGNLRKAAEFIVNIGKGNFDAKYEVKVAEGIDEKDNLSAALLNMRDRLKNVYDEDKKRNWATEGFARFGEILRLNTDDMKKLSDDIISNLVKYMNANQGSIFIVNDNSPDDVHLELTACYAWNRKKFVEKRFGLGEGLAGQVWQEGESIFMSDVPDDYIRITSGLGDANPKCILIAPLKINEQIYGIIELATFNILEKYEIEFVEKLGESIASTISGLKINIRTKKLLEESQQMTEELKAQEEEVRQNMEEMTATQEELQRKEIETQKLLAQSKEQAEQLRNSMKEMERQQEEIVQYKELSEAQRKTTHSMLLFFKTDVNGKITYVNDEVVKYSKYSREELIGRGNSIFNSNHHPNSFFTDLWNTITSGKVWRNEILNKAKDGSYFWVDTTVAPIFNKEGKIIEFVTQGLVITDKKKKEEETKKELETCHEKYEATLKELEELKKRQK